MLQHASTTRVALADEYLILETWRGMYPVLQKHGF